jgi:hypothetical protein
MSDLSIEDNDNYNIVLYYMGTSLYKNMKYFQSMATSLGMDNDDNYNLLMSRNVIRFEDIQVSNDDSLKLLHREIGAALEQASYGVHNKYNLQ